MCNFETHDSVVWLCIWPQFQTAAVKAWGELNPSPNRSILSWRKSCSSRFLRSRVQVLALRASGSGLHSPGGVLGRPGLAGC